MFFSEAHSIDPRYALKSSFSQREPLVFPTMPSSCQETSLWFYRRDLFIGLGVGSSFDHSDANLMTDRMRNISYINMESIFGEGVLQ